MDHSSIEMARREAVRQGELLLSSQMQIATIADQRAVNFCALTILVLTVLVGLVIEVKFDVLPLFALGFFAVSACLSALAIKPTRFYGAGGTYETFQPLLTDRFAEFTWHAIAIRNDESIRLNDAAVKRGANFFRIALISAAVGGGILVFYLIYSAAEYSRVAFVCAYPPQEHLQ